MENTSTFTYTYSAHRNQEVLAIRQRYLPRQETALEELKRLDHDVQMSGTVEGLTVGIVGCLVFGLGMCMAMEIIGSSRLPGIFASLMGAAIMLAAYPVYRSISGKTKAKLTPRILQLADQLSA